MLPQINSPTEFNGVNLSIPAVDFVFCDSSKPCLFVPVFQMADAKILFLTGGIREASLREFHWAGDISDFGPQWNDLRIARGKYFFVTFNFIFSLPVKLRSKCSLNIYHRVRVAVVEFFRMMPSAILFSNKKFRLGLPAYPLSANTLSMVCLVWRLKAVRYWSKLVSFTEAGVRVVARIKPWLTSMEVYPVKFWKTISLGRVLWDRNEARHF